MMKWSVVYTPKALKDYDSLDNSQQRQVLKAIGKVSANPLPQSQGGYGKPLGNQSTGKLAGCLKIKLRKLGIRIVYQLVTIKDTGNMTIIVISMRDDEKVYRLAVERLLRR